MNSLIEIYTDGASRGNPGLAGAGWVFKKNNKIIHKGKKFLEKITNNQAEYLALINALQDSHKQGYNNISLYLDSELIVKQIKKEYKVKNDKMIPLYKQVIKLLENIQWTITHVKRDKNKDADKLANESIDLR